MSPLSALEVSEPNHSVPENETPNLRASRDAPCFTPLSPFDDGELNLKPVVVARVRPVFASEVAAGAEPVVRVEPETGLVEIKAAKGSGEGQQKVLAVRCTHALDEGASNEDAYLKFRHMVDVLLDRCNVTLFAFGETGSGKTYTMEYITDRLLSDIWSQKRFYDSFDVRLSMVEIENEKIYDLTAKARTSLHILNYQVKGANWMEYHTEEQIRRDLGACWERRKTAATKLNATSSRSHAVCTVRISVSKAGMNFTSDAHIIDLAGSERSGLAAHDGNPNASLTLLSMIVKDITCGRELHTFRETKLTHLLQPALTGRCILGLVFTLNPCSARGATSSVQFASNMMRLPPAKPQRNRVEMTEAQLAAASQELLQREAEVNRRLHVAEERRAAAEEENERLRQELAEARRQRATQVKDDMHGLQAELEVFQSQVSRDRELLKIAVGCFQGYASRVCCALAPFLDTKEERHCEAAETLARTILSALTDSGRILGEVEVQYDAGSLSEAGHGLQQAAGMLEPLQPETLLKDLVMHLREALDGSCAGERSAHLVDSLQAELQCCLQEGLPAELGELAEAPGLSGAFVALGKRALVHADNGTYVHSLEVQIRLLRRQIKMFRQNSTPTPAPSASRAKRDAAALRRAKTNWQALAKAVGCSAPSSLSQLAETVQGELDEDIAQEIARIPDAEAYERLSQMVGRSKLFCHRFVQLGGVVRMATAGLKDWAPTSAEACRTAAHVNVFCKLHEARDQMRVYGGCELLVKILAAEGGSELDNARINACMAVQELSVGNTTNKKLFALSAMRMLVQLMASESPRVQEAASDALSTVLDGSAAAHVAARGAGGLEALLSLLLTRNNRVRLQAVHALGRIAANDQETQAYIKGVNVSSDAHQEPINGLACIVSGLVDNDETIRQAHGQTLLACVYGNADSLEALRDPETLSAVGILPEEVMAYLMRALAALVVQDASLPQMCFLTGDAGVISCVSDANFPHYGVLLSGSWERGSSSFPGHHPCHASFFRNPQFLVQVPNAMQVSIHLEVEVSGQHALNLWCFKVGKSCQEKFDVVFGDEVNGLVEHGEDSCTLTVDLDAGAYTIVVTNNCKIPEEKTPFKVSFVAREEFEAEAVPFLHGWHHRPCGARGCFQGWWHGGSDVTGEDFWRNPQFVVTQAQDSSGSRSRKSSELAIVAQDDSPINTTTSCMLVCVHLCKESDSGSADLVSCFEPGLAAYKHNSENLDSQSGPDSWHRPIGGFEMKDSSSQTLALTVLHRSPDRVVAVVARPTTTSAIILVPFLRGQYVAEAKVDFEISVFSATPVCISQMAEMCKEWNWVSTFSLPWRATKSSQSLSTSAAFQLAASQKLAVRCVCQGEISRRRERSILTLTHTGHPGGIISSQGAIGGLCVQTTLDPVASGTYVVEVLRRQCDLAHIPPNLLLQVFSEQELDFAGNDSMTLRQIQNIRLQLPRPHLGGPEAQQNLQVSSNNRISTMQSSLRTEAALHLSNVVSELKQEVANIKVSQTARRRITNDGTGSASKSIQYRTRSKPPESVSRSMDAGLLKRMQTMHANEEMAKQAAYPAELGLHTVHSAPQGMLQGLASLSMPDTSRINSSWAGTAAPMPDCMQVQGADAPGQMGESPCPRCELSFDSFANARPSDSSTCTSPLQDFLIIQERDEALQKLQEARAENEALEQRVQQLEAMIAAKE